MKMNEIEKYSLLILAQISMSGVQFKEKEYFNFEDLIIDY